MQKTNSFMLAGVLFITFGITYLDFDRPTFELNLKPYIMLITGVVVLAVGIIKRAQAAGREK